ncbi:hypothetical protein [Dyadobacter aurulentus]|uniref:hypothetical protein n=1 Tax=Dyadobacter sp. UC 10 TaxID=2605428 RepID=UPI0011F3E2CD|nr:hypothetical protein [Dyadobacter sp. UC 10]KAA0989169.1 hypothetical protein FXO21_02805 [Dyadobacter sp. UC 10]
MPVKTLKIILTTLYIIQSIAASATVCIPIEFIGKYETSAFIARVTITSVVPNEKDRFYYKSDISIRTLYKGPRITSILIEGSSDGKVRMTSDIFFPKNTELLVYARLNEDGQHIFGSCSGYQILDKKPSHATRRELAMLDVLKKKHKPGSTIYRYSAEFGDQLKPLRGISLSKSFAIYEITFGSGRQIDSVRTVSGFTYEIDEKLKTIVKSADWIGHDPDPGASKGKKRLVAFYYYEAEKNELSFIGEWDV